MNKTKIKLFLFALLSFSCEKPSELNNLISQLEYQVYACVIDSLYKNNTDSFLVLTDSTDKNHFANLVKGFKNGKRIEFNELDRLGYKDSLWYKSDYKDLITDYQDKNKINLPIKSEYVKSSIKLKQIASDSLKKIFSKDSWSEFYRIFPKALGIINFSRVGFNKEKNQAVLFHSINMYDHNAEGIYVLLYKEVKWKIKITARAWVS